MRQIYMIATPLAFEFKLEWNTSATQGHFSVT